MIIDTPGVCPAFLFQAERQELAPASEIQIAPPYTKKAPAISLQVLEFP